MCNLYVINFQSSDFFRFKSSLIFPLMILGVIALHNSCKMFWKLAKRKLEVINYKNTLLQRK